MTSSTENLSFEDALNELEKIVRNLESGQLKLEDAIQAYERGSALKRLCEEKLNAVEARIEAIVHKNDGSIAVEPMDKE
ncbi:exodeoxyribonuclease VII small subunit [Entomobacter blattae]|uniref:Exodeoxyribonuclease 7 small subunit n=1 Tax=Entomobacter blattae TaxID=2762277 RepID=A0A7H1NUU1_9PROT|nr:exodeoxyribonuclease VII small subunit [Entomobacter blattae]QNT79551.1 Exodeoxyribonuclease 7 small subunit [Entomobacter blattae]